MKARSASCPLKAVSGSALRLCSLDTVIIAFLELVVRFSNRNHKPMVLPLKYLAIMSLSLLGSLFSEKDLDRLSSKAFFAKRELRLLENSMLFG